MAARPVRAAMGPGVRSHRLGDSWERFRGETLMPGMQEMGDAGGFAEPPEETTFEVDKLQEA
jgi:hypothetical protein